MGTKAIVCDLLLIFKDGVLELEFKSVPQQINISQFRIILY